MRNLLPLLFVLGACGEKAPPASAGTAQADASAASSTVSGAPSDANSQAFARALVGTSVKNFSPSGGSGAKFMYNSLQFQADGNFTAAGFVEMDDERMDCNETGKWSMDPADSKTVATVTWKVDETNCAGREPGEQSRAQVDLSDPADPKFLYR